MNIVLKIENDGTTYNRNYTINFSLLGPSVTPTAPTISSFNTTMNITTDTS